jgi:hypothetical protein
MLLSNTQNLRDTKFALSHTTVLQVEKIVEEGVNKRD